MQGESEELYEGLQALEDIVSNDLLELAKEIIREREEEAHRLGGPTAGTPDPHANCGKNKQQQKQHSRCHEFLKLNHP